MNIIEKLHRLQGGAGGERGADYQLLGGQVVADGILRRFKNYFNLNAKVSSAKTLRHNIFPKMFKTSEIVALTPLTYYYMSNIEILVPEKSSFGLFTCINDFYTRNLRSHKNDGK